MTAWRSGTRINRKAWKLPIPRTPRPESDEPQATAHPCVRTPARRKAKPRLSVRPTEIHGGVWSSVGKVYHRAGTHPERRIAIQKRRPSNTSEREALGLGGRRQGHSGSADYNARSKKGPRTMPSWEAVWEGSTVDRNA